jgi:hypothetical protein
MGKKLLFTFSVSATPLSCSINDAIRHWLKGNGYDWYYDQYSRLTTTLKNGPHRFSSRINGDACHVYAIPV